MKYLAITIDERRAFGKHIEVVISKAAKRVAILARIMTNIGGSLETAVLFIAMHNIVLSKTPYKKKY